MKCTKFVTKLERYVQIVVLHRCINSCSGCGLQHRAKFFCYSHKTVVCVVAAVTENILNFALSLYSVYMKFFLPSVVKLGCKRCISWKR